jgi:hypothetical protein
VVALIQEQPPRHSRLDLLDCLPSSVVQAHGSTLGRAS